MSKITIINILDKIRSICKDFPLIPMPERSINQDFQTNLEGYYRALQFIRLELIKHKNLENQYLKLQQFLQREQTQIRKRIGVENELKLLTDTLKSQLEQIQKQKIDLLQNTKVHIKQLKKTNQNLFSKLKQEINKNRSQNKQKSHSKSKDSPSKISKYNSQSRRKYHKDPFKNIIQTEQIDRKKNKSKRQIHETISDNQPQPQSYQINISTKKKTTQNIKKKHNQTLQNHNAYSFFEPSKTKIKKYEKSNFGRSPRKEQKKKQTNSRIHNTSKCLWKDRKLNKSVYSVVSLQRNSNHKQTI